MTAFAANVNHDEGNDASQPKSSERPEQGARGCLAHTLLVQRAKLTPDGAQKAGVFQ